MCTQRGADNGDTPKPTIPSPLAGRLHNNFSGDAFRGIPLAFPVARPLGMDVPSTEALAFAGMIGVWMVWLAGRFANRRYGLAGWRGECLWRMRVLLR